MHAFFAMLADVWHLVEPNLSAVLKPKYVRMTGILFKVLLGSLAFSSGTW
jgi:hypothetical protein